MKLGIPLIFCLIGAIKAEETNAVIDLSHWNGRADFKEAKADGVAAVIHKATQGLTYTDPKYSDRKILAEKEGLLWGAYHFGVGGRSGANQANHFLRTVGDTSKVLLALDIEVNNAGKNMSVEEADEFVRTVKEKTGRYPIIYGSPSYLESFKTPALKSCPLWVAHYTNNQRPKLTQSRDSWVLWQYTDGRTGGSPRSVKGIGNCDRNRYSGTLAQLKSKWPNL